MVVVERARAARDACGVALALSLRRYGLCEMLGGTRENLIEVRRNDVGGDRAEMIIELTRCLEVNMWEGAAKH